MQGIPLGRVQTGPSNAGRHSSGGRALLQTRADGTGRRPSGPGPVLAVPAVPAACGARPRLPSRLSLGSGRAASTAGKRVPEPGAGWPQRAAPSGSAACSQPSPRATPATRGLRAGRAAAAAAMGEDGGRRAAEPERLALELGRERRKQQMLESSIFELRHTITELEKSLNSAENEDNEWKTRYETQVELNKQLERQINILQDKVELIRGNPADKLFIVRTFDKMPVDSLKRVLKQLEEEKKSLQNQLKDYELRLEQEAKAYHKVNDERRMYLSEILQTSAKFTIVEKQKTDALTGKGEGQILRGRRSVPGNLKMVNTQKRSIKKTVGVNHLPQLKH
ncbi:coiled-coil domain-containing protein 169 [Hirundo rustica]|uniref:coiled-coil domain-containing protein 169 n=1 Tax=Hirundo rustica TaxID=43150 RepID=UPI001A94BE8F|nr:coiled-coil domain-containing protein 169 [Hirundo rustica]